MYARWRTSVSRKHSRDSPCLILPTEDAHNQCKSGLLKAKARSPTEVCGVSLQFLLSLAKSLKDLNLEGRARTTKMVVSKFFSPAGSLQPFPSSSRCSSVLHLAQSSSLESMQDNSLNDLTQAISESGRLPSSPSKPRSRRSSILAEAPAAAAKETRTRLWDFIDPHWCGQPSYYVSHFWDDDFLDMLATLVDRIARQLEHDREAQEENEPVDLNTIFVWLDVLALPQQSLGPNATLDGPTFGPPPGYIDPDAVKKIICSCKKGVVIVLDPNMDILNRVWPLYEVWVAAYYCPQDVSPCRVYAAIPKDVNVDVLLHLQTSCLSILDLGRAVASRAEDKHEIMTAVRHAAGQKRMQTLASESILRAVRSWLRWSGDLQDMAMYVALMLQAKESTRLQYVLNAVDGIHSDEVTLQEVRKLFKMYDEDGTGSLNEAEFTRVLGLAGLGPEESRNIFHQADTHGEGCVELNEFETWWIKSQKQMNGMRRPKPGLTVSGLVTNLKGLAAMLRNREKHAAAESISKLMEGIKALAAGPKSPFPDGQLPPSEVYGDWRLVANTLGFKAALQDLRPALRMMHGLLMSNVDALALESNPAALLPSPNSLGNDPKLQRVVLAWFMALIAELLSRNPGTLREADFFLRKSMDMSNPVQDKVDPQAAVSVVEAGLKKSRKEHMKVGLKNACKDAEMESIIISMVRLKHGKDIFVSDELVAEANKSLRAWVAASKPSCKLGSSRNQSAPDFAKSYLAMADANNAQSDIASETNDGSTTEGGSQAAEESNQKNKAQAVPQNPSKGNLYSEHAYSLGVSCLAAIRRYKESAIAESCTGSPGEILDHFEVQESPIADPLLRRSKSAASPDSHQPTEYGSPEKFLRKSISRPHHALPPSDGSPPTTKDSRLRRTSAINDSLGVQPLAHNGQQKQTEPPFETDPFKLDTIGHAKWERALPAPPTFLLPPLLATHTSSKQPPQERPPYSKSAPIAGAELPQQRSPFSMPLRSDKAVYSSESRTGRQESEKSFINERMKSAFDPNRLTFVSAPREVEHSDLRPRFGSVSPPRSVLRREAIISTHDTCLISRVSFLPLPALKRQGSAEAPEQSSGTLAEDWVGGLPDSVVSSTIGNSFAQRVAAAKEQQRVTKLMVQTQVSTSDVEALRQRMSFTTGSKAHIGPDRVPGSMPNGLQDVRSRSLSHCASYAKRDRDSSQDQTCLVSARSSPELEETPSAEALLANAPSKKTPHQPLEPLQGRGSRLRKSSIGSQVASGLTLMLQHSDSVGPKWLSQLSGTNLPRLKRSKSTTTEADASNSSSSSTHASGLPNNCWPSTLDPEHRLFDLNSQN